MAHQFLSRNSALPRTSAIHNTLVLDFHKMPMPLYLPLYLAPWDCQSTLLRLHHSTIRVITPNILICAQIFLPWPNISRSNARHHEHRRQWQVLEHHATSNRRSHGSLQTRRWYPQSLDEDPPTRSNPDSPSRRNYGHRARSRESRRGRRQAVQNAASGLEYLLCIRICHRVSHD